MDQASIIVFGQEFSAILHRLAHDSRPIFDLQTVCQKLGATGTSYPSLKVIWQKLTTEGLVEKGESSTVVPPSKNKVS